MFIPLLLVLLVSGLFWLCSAPRKGEAAIPLPAGVRFALFGQAGILALTAGADTIRLMPPLTITKAEIDAGLDILKQILSTY